MGRPKEFDRDEALDKAIEVFRWYGYRGASMQTLVNAMGVNRFSLYETFGDKAQLFLEAFDRYEKRRRDALQHHLQKPLSSKDRIRAYFESVVEEVLTPPISGCLLIGSVVELSSENPTVYERCLRNFDLMEEMFYCAVVEGQEAGDIRASLDPRAIGRFLISSVRGVRLTAKVVQDRNVLLDIVATTLSILD